MLTIHAPTLAEEADRLVLRAVLEDGSGKRDLWFSTGKIFAPYFTHELADPFLVALLTYAMRNHHDIKVLGVPVSERLYHNLTRSVICALKDTFPEYRHIAIHCKTTNQLPPSAGAVGTGISCGVDSLSAIAAYTAEDTPPNHRLTHLAFFNVGANGDFGGEQEQRLFNTRTRLVQEASAHIGLPLVIVDSNLSEIVQMDFLQFCTFRTISAVLTLQKLFGTYYLASSFPLADFHMSSHAASYYDVYTLSMLSTTHVALLSADVTASRIEKTKRIADLPLAHKFLNVCVKSETNCGICHKCVRTLMTLEVLGKLHSFSRVFDLDLFYRNRHKCVALVLAESHHDFFHREIRNLMREYRYKIPRLAWLYAALYRCLYARKAPTVAVARAAGRLR